MDQELLKQRKEKYRQWLHNHNKHKANAKAPMKLRKKWTAHQVIEEQRKADILQQIHEEIEEETGQKPGQTEVLRRYQPTMMAIMKGLDHNELEEAQAKADEWTNQAPDPVVQAKTARKNDQALRQRDIYSGQFNFNEHPRRGSSFMKCKDWQVILLAWEDFIGDEFRICCGKRKVPVPWSDIMKGQSQFISSTYLPDDIKITDPSKMQRDEANALLESWIDDKGKMHSPIGEDSDDSDADADDEGLWPRPTTKSSATAALSSAGLPKRPTRFIKQAHVSSADEESNNTDAYVSLPKVRKDAPDCVGKGAITEHSDQSLILAMLPVRASAPLKAVTRLLLPNGAHSVFVDRAQGATGIWVGAYTDAGEEAERGEESNDAEAGIFEGFSLGVGIGVVLGYRSFHVEGFCMAMAVMDVSAMKGVRGLWQGFVIGGGSGIMSFGGEELLVLVVAVSSSSEDSSSWRTPDLLGFFVVLVSSAHLQVEPGIVCSMAFLLALEAEAFIEALLLFLRCEGTIHVHSIRVTLVNLWSRDVPVAGGAYQSVVGSDSVPFVNGGGDSLLRVDSITKPSLQSSFEEVDEREVLLDARSGGKGLECCNVGCHVSNLCEALELSHSLSLSVDGLEGGVELGLKVFERAEVHWDLVKGLPVEGVCPDAYFLIQVVVVSV
ncbi:uncharacterized protein F5147DRAFT_782115 [Suillus discolor]|uniref:Uncharacterized protein n=1 Tax=Suillus discolor TaxID=1912936 RepID=A0A9P7JKY9_9AGAM|nr:uncharacterized protein F5147DRAFT_782115 [Suillus discolor]KAG2085282.1 hypothetical protein F5147DRAFT_782115 [Suillus discolor]